MSTADPEPVDPVLAEIRRLRAAFDTKIRYDEVRERLVESMTEELAAHRQGLFQLQLRPILFDLITMYDDLTKMSGSSDCLPATASALLFFRDTVGQTLARSGVEAFNVEGQAVDRTRQKVINVIETADPAADRTVAERCRAGFSWNGKVLRPEWVSVYVARSSGGVGNDADNDNDSHAGDVPDAGSLESLEDVRAAVEEGAQN